MAEESRVTIGPQLGLLTADSLSRGSNLSDLIYAKIVALGEKHKLRENPTPLQKRRAAISAWACGYALLLRNLKFKKEKQRESALHAQLYELERTLRALSPDE